MALHKNRRWTVIDKDHTPEELAVLLTEHTWCCCNGFRCGNALWLNDSTGPDGAQEYAVVRISDAANLVQIESITVSWCKYQELLDYARRYGADDPGVGIFSRVPRSRIETPREHGTCGHCA